MKLTLLRNVSGFFFGAPLADSKEVRLEIAFHRWGRVALGVFLILRLAALFPDVGFFFSDDGTLPTSEALKAMPFMLPFWIELAPDSALGWQLFTGGVFLSVSVGFILASLWGWEKFPRLSEPLFRISGVSVVLFFCIAMSRNDLLWNSADKYLYILTLFLTLSPRSIPWGRRMIQLQSSLLYCSTVLLKWEGPLWQKGLATYPVLQLPEFFHGPLGPLRTWTPFIAASTYGTLVLEMLLCTLIWVPKFRLPVAAVGVFFHLSLDYALNIPLFPWISSFALIAHAWPDLMARDHRKWLSFRNRLAPPNRV